ncbi:MAG TPA: hypothetical protein ENI56_00670 [Candidatus Kaiserbacteria bacterium]|nr:hypothetical protein [Candidatus Kaiserbacteria bacterium]
MSEPREHRRGLAKYEPAMRGVSRWRTDGQFTTGIAPSLRRNGGVVAENRKKNVIISISHFGISERTRPTKTISLPFFSPIGGGV